MKKMNKLEKELYAVCRRNAASCNQIANAMKAVRARLQDELFYQKPVQHRRIPVLQDETQLKRYFAAFDTMKDPQYKLWAKTIYDTMIRVHELVAILVSEINFEAKTILIHGKGDNHKGKKDRVVTMSDRVAELLQLHVRNHPLNIWLFESTNKKHHAPYSVRMVQIIFNKAARLAGITGAGNPHAGRHVMITEFAKSGIPNPVTMLQTGHDDEKSLGIYQHLAIGQFAPQFNAVRDRFWTSVS